jgi:hypothetical protein
MLHCEILNRLRDEKPEKKEKMKIFESRGTPVHILSTAGVRAGSIELQRLQNDCNNTKTEIQGSEFSTNRRRDVLETHSHGNETVSADARKDDNLGFYNPDSLTKVLANSSTTLPQVLISVALKEELLLDFDQCLRWFRQFPAFEKYAKVQGVYRSNPTLLILALPVLVWDCIPDDPACSFIGYINSSNILAGECNEDSSSIRSTIKHEEDSKSRLKMGDVVTAKTHLASKISFHNHPYSRRESNPTILSHVDGMSRANSPWGQPTTMPGLSSNSSSRTKQRLQDRINLAAMQRFTPKIGSEYPPLSPDVFSQSINPLENGPVEKLAIPLKATYQRPTHDKIGCKLCDREGFRGVHELQRHVDREHKTTIKKWICVEPPEPGHPTPVVPLSKCKACHQLKREYCAYYNAAAHLRRTHFKPKKSVRTKVGTKIEDGEKRGGKGGGDWPPMSELRLWMKEIEVPTGDSWNRKSAEPDDDAESEQEAQYGEAVFPSVGLDAFDGLRIQDNPTHSPFFEPSSVNYQTLSNDFSLPPLNYQSRGFDGPSMPMLDDMSFLPPIDDDYAYNFFK